MNCTKLSYIQAYTSERHYVLKDLRILLYQVITQRQIRFYFNDENVNKVTLDIRIEILYLINRTNSTK